MQAALGQAVPSRPSWSAGTPDRAFAGSANTLPWREGSSVGT